MNIISKTDSQEELLFDEFSGMISRRIKDYLPPEYTDAQIMVFKARRLRDSYNAMQLIPSNASGGVPIINLDMLYEAYYQGMPWDEILQTAASIVLTPSDFDIEEYLRYDYAKSHLLMRVSNWDENQDIADDTPYKKIGGIMITYHIFIKDPRGECGTVRISHEVMDDFGITLTELHRDAAISSMLMAPPILIPMNEIALLKANRVFSNKRTFDKTLKKLDFRKNVFYELTTRYGRDGASAMFYPDILKKIARQGNCDLYVVPTSIQEVMLIPHNADVRESFLKEALAHANESKKAFGLMLADSVFCYRRLTDELIEI